jgi:hypothetical protein
MRQEEGWYGQRAQERWRQNKREQQKRDTEKERERRGGRERVKRSIILSLQMERREETWWPLQVQSRRAVPPMLFLAQIYNPNSALDPILHLRLY